MLSAESHVMVLTNFCVSVCAHARRATSQAMRSIREAKERVKTLSREQHFKVEVHKVQNLPSQVPKKNGKEPQNVDGKTPKP